MAIDAKEFTEKDELIAKFYTLRAGLSAAAEEAEKVEKAENELRTVGHAAFNHPKRVAERIEYKLEALKEEHEYRIKRIDLKYDEPLSEYYPSRRKLTKLKTAEELKEYYKGVTLGIFWVPFVIIAFACGFALFGEIDIVPMAMAAIPITLIIGNLFKLLVAKLYMMADAGKCKRTMKKYEHQIQLYEDEINQEKREYEKQVKELEEKTKDPDNEEYFADFYEDKVEKAKAHFGKIRPYHTARAQAITQALHQQFDSILNEADWENVDLLIFYLNTGRADSLKEALQLVDRQRQTDQISSAIRTAAEHISFTMQSNTYRLAQVMTGCFSELSKQIQQNHVAVLSSMDQTTEAISRLSGSVGSLNSNLQSIESGIQNQNQLLLDANQLNDALLKHANKSSQDLMYELRYNQRYWQ